MCLVRYSNKPDIVRKDVNVVARRHGQGDLELARQVVWSIQWLIVLQRTTHKQLARTVSAFVEPDLVVCIHAWQQVVREAFRKLIHFLVNLVQMQIRRAHHIAVHITARSYRVQHAPVNALHRSFHVPFENHVVLYRLPGRDLKRLDPSVLLRHLVELQPLFWRTHTAWHTHADHKAVRGLETCCLALIHRVAVVLHIRAVEFG